MYIVGTSGHIDHGKTSLIMALTGTDCDRLPEEKERAMTIDIGFAHMDYPRFGTVSIIDVPGHERFIRNMVAGAWGIDLALLVVAVDDGWMPQTEDHFRVLELLGVERIIAVLNKIDLADDEMISFVEEEVKERLSETRFAGSDLVKVSSKDLTGIDELKDVIVANLRQLSRVTDAQKPYLFIDRVFGAKGHGTVITGTLKNGQFHEDETVTILPTHDSARIKRIESHYHIRHEGTPSQRTALNLASLSMEKLKRGYLVCRENFFTASDDIIVRVQLLDEKYRLRNNQGIEILIGTTALKGKVILYEDQAGHYLNARIRLEKGWFSYPGEPFVLTTPGGYRIIGGGQVLLPDYSPDSQKASVRHALSLLERVTLDEIFSFIVAVHHCIPRQRLFSMFPESEKTMTRLLGEQVESGFAREEGEYVMESSFYHQASDTIKEAVRGQVGLNLKEIADMAGVSLDVARILMGEVIEKEPIIEKEGRYFYGSDISEEALSDHKKRLLESLLQKGGQGIELDKMPNDRDRKDLKDMVKIGFIVSLDGNILYHKEVYEDLRDRIMALFNEKEKLMVPEAKDAAGGLSRKYIIPLLNRMESDGLIKRLGDFRIRA